MTFVSHAARYSKVATGPRVLICAVAAGAAIANFACSSDPASALAGPGAKQADGGASSDGAAGPKLTPEQMFRALESDLVKTCGGTNGACHVTGALQNAGKWLAPPDAYASAKAWRGVVPDDNILEHSIVLTQIEHTGPSLASSPSLFARVREWVAAEINGAVLPGSDPFEVHAGFNVVDLSKAAAGAQGAKLRFTATLGNKVLTLSGINLAAPPTRGLDVTTPFFVVLPAKGPVISDTNNGFTGDLEVAAGQNLDVFGGSLVLLNFETTTKLQIVFQKIVTTAAPDAGASTGGCKSVATFTSSAVPALKLDLGNGQTCLGCHGGGNDVAKNALDLSAVDANDAQACAQALNYVSLKDKANSQIIAVPTGGPGGNTNHAIQTAPQAFTDGMLGWIKNE